ncbi:MAG: pyruvate, water dikinase regulatory protein [Tissierellia bacterium]|nr:pyruvate, water dikinase regulatory protein [Tissierellia bacterium]
MIHLIVVSDSTGETGEQIVRAAAAQFNIESPHIKRYSHVRDLGNLKEVLESIDTLDNKIVYYSLVDEALIDYTKKFCDYNDIYAVDILTPSIIAIERLTNLTPMTQPGALRKMDEKYFKRVDAIEFAVRYDDGKDPRGARNADITIIGVSRTSKTPLSMYLANRNYRVCNIPLVPESPVPDVLFEIPPKKIIGLTNTPEKLNKIRKERLKALGLPSNSSYSDYERIFQELEFSHGIMKRIGCPIFDVSDRAIEETAELIIRHMKKFKS